MFRRIQNAPIRRALKVFAVRVARMEMVCPEDLDLPTPSSSLVHLIASNLHEKSARSIREKITR